MSITPIPKLYYETPELPLDELHRSDLRRINIYPIRQITRENLSTATISGLMGDVTRAACFSLVPLVAAYAVQLVTSPVPSPSPVLTPRKLLGSAITGGILNLAHLSSQTPATTETVLSALHLMEHDRFQQANARFLHLHAVSGQWGDQQSIARQEAEHKEEIRTLFAQLDQSGIDKEGKNLLKELTEAYAKDDKQLIKQMWTSILERENTSLLGALKQEKVILAKAVRSGYIELSEEIPEEYLCAIQGELMLNPVADPTTGGKQFYEKARITDWLEKDVSSPMSRLDWPKTEDGPVITVDETKQQEILNWVVKQIEREELPALEEGSSQEPESSSENQSFLTPSFQDIFW